MRFYTLFCFIFLSLFKTSQFEEIPIYDDGVEIETTEDTPVDLNRFKRNTENILKSYIDKLKNVSTKN